MRIVFAALMLAFATSANAGSVAAWRSHVEEASARFGIPAAWIERVMRAESRGHTTFNGRPIVSRAGAMGLMQLMPGTWADMRARLGLGDDPHRPRDNILAGTLYLRLMHDRFGYPGLFAAYNAGPRRYAQHLATGRPLPGETRAYLTAVGGVVPPGRGSRATVSARPVDTVFFALRSSPARAANDAGNPGDLFITVSAN